MSGTENGPGVWRDEEGVGLPIARTILTAFLSTFLLARIFVYLVTSHRIPNLYLSFEGIHVHHLNYGIFLLAGVGAYLLFRRPSRRALLVSAAVYGVGLGLTFDEFGMWLHLNEDYWQRASYDAVVAISAALGLAILGGRLRRFRPGHWVAVVGLLLLFALFAFLLIESIR